MMQGMKVGVVGVVLPYLIYRQNNVYVHSVIIKNHVQVYPFIAEHMRKLRNSNILTSCCSLEDTFVMVIFQTYVYEHW